MSPYYILKIYIDLQSHEKNNVGFPLPGEVALVDFAALPPGLPKYKTF
jgi:hypothetical protein